MNKKSFLKKIINNKLSLDVLMEFENILDENHFYVFDNWIEGEIVSGPIISKYHVNILMRYPDDLKPDLSALKRLDIFDIKYKVKRVGKIYYNDDNINGDNINPITGSNASNQLNNLENNKTKVYFWLIEFVIPRRLFKIL